MSVDRETVRAAIQNVLDNDERAHRPRGHTADALVELFVELFVEMSEDERRARWRGRVAADLAAAKSKVAGT